MAEENIKDVLVNFNIPQDDYSAEVISHGLINKSYLIRNNSNNRRSYFLQKIDHHIFKDIDGLMNNIKVVINQINNLVSPPNHLTTINTKKGHNYFKSDLGTYWRLYDFIDGKTYYRAENSKMATEAGLMYGQFLAGLTSLDTGLLVATIPGFHDINLRYDQFKTSLLNARPERLRQANHLIDLIESDIESIKTIYQNVIDVCPLRATHNDTKLSNLLFDENRKGICVVDYDTLMPGYLPFDFADTVRTLCSKTLEDSSDLDSTKINLKLFEVFTHAFLMQLSGSVINDEIDLLADSVPYMPFLMGLRMLTDFLNNDIYYATKYQQHNFDRAANQFTLYKNGVEELDELNNIVKNSKLVLNL